ncbi:MAG TPA: FlgD immunoglobulin-like domain containing protein, partial [Rhodothermales bacterium]
AFGQSRDGELYVLGTDRQGPSGSTGMVYRLVPAGGTATEPEDQAPTAFALRQNYPNPFNPTTEIQFDLAETGTISLTIFDALGREVEVLAQGTLPAGRHRVTWDGLDAGGHEAPSGIYVYQLRTERGTASRVMTLIR